MNTATFIKYLIPVDGRVALATLTFADTSTADVYDSDDDLIISDLEARQGVSDAGKSISQVTNIEILPDCTEVGVQAFRQYSPYNWDPVDGVDLTGATSLTRINDSAFKFYSDCLMGTDVQIPNTVTYIGVDAFASWYIMPNGVQLGTGVQTIGDKAFSLWQASNNTNTLTIPNSVTTIGDEAFASWESTTGGLTIGNSVQDIPYRAFFDWKVSNSGIDLTIPNSVQSIGEQAFWSWEEHTGGLVIGSGVKTIGDTAFFVWRKTNSGGDLVIPTSVTDIGTQSFQQWEIHTGGLVLGSGLKTIGQSAFAQWWKSNNGNDLVIPSSVTTIESQAFNSWNETTRGVNLTGASALTTIGDRAFKDWVNATDMTTDLVIPSNVTSIGEFAFYNWNKMTKGVNLTGATSLTVIEPSTFANWWDANPSGPLTVPNNITEIKQSAFDGWQEMQYTVNLGNVVTIGDYAFRAWGVNIVAGAGLTIPNTVITIGGGAFQQWGGALSIGTGVQSIGDLAFQAWWYATSDLTIPSSVTSIGSQAFSSWAKFNTGTVYELTFLGTAPPATIGSSAFSDWQNGQATIVNVPAGANLCVWKTTLTGKGSFASINGVAWDDICSLALFTFTDTSTVLVPDVGSDGILTQVEARDTVNGAGKSAGDLTDLKILSTCNEISDLVFNHYTAYPWNSVNGIDFSTATALTHIKVRAFDGWIVNLSGDIVFPASLEYIGTDAFNEWSNNTNGVDLSNCTSLQVIDNDAFFGWDSVTMSSDLVIPKSVSRLGTFAFGRWNVNPNGVVFDGATNDTSSLLTIDTAAFEYWRAADMTSDMVIPKSVTHINGQAFSGWLSMTKGVIFKGATDDTSSLQYIGIFAFGESDGNSPRGGWPLADMASNLNIPNTVTVIDIRAFKGWKAMTKGVTFNSVIPPTFGSDAFAEWDFHTGGIPITVTPLGTTPSSLSAYKAALTGSGTFASINGVAWASIP